MSQLPARNSRKTIPAAPVRLEPRTAALVTCRRSKCPRCTILSPITGFESSARANLSQIKETLQKNGHYSFRGCPSNKSGTSNTFLIRTAWHRYFACGHENPGAPEIPHFDGSAERDFPLDISSNESVTSGTLLIVSVTFLRRS